MMPTHKWEQMRALHRAGKSIASAYGAQISIVDAAWEYWIILARKKQAGTGLSNLPEQMSLSVICS